MSTPNGLLAKFDNITTEDKLPIAEADLGYCVRMERLYVEKKQELETQLELVSEMGAIAPKVNYTKVSQYSRGDYYLDEDFEKRREVVQRNVFDRYLFKPMEVEVELRNYLRAIKKDFVTEIVRYFNAEYNMDLHIAEDYFFEKKKSPNYKDLVDILISKCDNVPFAEIGKRRFLDAIHRQIGNANQLSKKKTRITITNFFSFYTDFRGKYEWSSSSSSLSKLSDMFGYFEDGNLQGKLLAGELNLRYQEVQFGLMDIDSVEKIESIKLYKNGKIEINFTTVEAVEEFYTKLELHKLPEGR